MQITRCRICDSFVCELEQHSQVRKLYIVTHLRSESQLDHLERLEEDQQRIEIEYQSSPNLHEREFVLGNTHVVVCDRGLDMYTKMRRGMRRTRQCRVLYFEVHDDFNAADRAANAPVSAPVTPPVRSQQGRPAPSTLENLPVHGRRSGRLPVVSHGVRPRKVHTGPDLGWASLAQRVADEDVSSDSECSLLPRRRIEVPLLP